jgi:glycosyltransferase involved in cell wall biosynthesis
MAGARVGLNVLDPTPHHTVAIGNKMFEYMAAGLPQVHSDFPLWREIIEKPGLGLAVKPDDPAAIAAALRHLFEHPQEAQAMGRRARAAVEERYNWQSQEPALLELYEGLEVRESAAPGPLGLSGLRP